MVLLVTAACHDRHVRDGHVRDGHVRDGHVRDVVLLVHVVR